MPPDGLVAPPDGVVAPDAPRWVSRVSRQGPGIEYWD